MQLIIRWSNIKNLNIWNGEQEEEEEEEEEEEKEKIDIDDMHMVLFSVACYMTLHPTLAAGW